MNRNMEFRPHYRLPEEDFKWNHQDLAALISNSNDKLSPYLATWYAKECYDKKFFDFDRMMS